jgi:hypothetical protein
LIRFRRRPELAALIPGCRIDVRLSDGLRLPVRLQRLDLEGLSYEECRDMPWEYKNAFIAAKPLILLKLSPGLSQELTPAGTELWFDESAAEDGCCDL